MDEKSERTDAAVCFQAKFCGFILLEKQIFLNSRNLVKKSLFSKLNIFVEFIKYKNSKIIICFYFYTPKSRI